MSANLKPVIESALGMSQGRGVVNVCYGGIASHTGGEGRIITQISHGPKEKEYHSITTINGGPSSETPTGPLEYVAPVPHFFQDFSRVIKDFIEVPQSKILTNKSVSTRMCLACKQNNTDVSFRKCGHLVLCNRCATSMEVMKGYYTIGTQTDATQSREYRIRCPMCSEPVSKIVLVK